MDTIKVILWDIDGTLLDFVAAERAAIRTCFEAFEFGECTDEMLGTYHEINQSYWRRLERGELTKPEILEGRFRDFFSVYGLDTSVVPQFNMQYQICLGDTICFKEYGWETVQACKNKVLQYAVTNGTKVAQDRKLKNSGLIDVFDGVFISDEVGYEKPAVEFFEKVFEEIGTYKSEEVMIVGDSLTSDIKGGNNAGIVTCWYNPTGQASDETLRIDYEIKDLRDVLKIQKEHGKHACVMKEWNE